MLGELVKPIDTLINRSCDGVIGFLKPWQMKRIAKAEIEILQLKAQSELKGSGVLVDSQKLMINETIQKQANLHNIRIEALSDIEDDQPLGDISEEFLNSFVDKASKVSEETLQQLWGKVLAGELKTKGSFSKRTLDFISTLDIKEANDIYDLFNGLVLFAGKPELLIGKSPSFFSKNIQVSLPTQETYDHLEHLGLFSSAKPLKINIFKSQASDNGLVCLKNAIITLDKKVALDIQYDFSTFKSKDVESCIITKTPLTSLGKELAQIVRPAPSRKTLKRVAYELGDANMFFKFQVHRYHA